MSYVKTNQELRGFFSVNLGTSSAPSIKRKYIGGSANMNITLSNDNKLADIKAVSELQTESVTAYGYTEDAELIQA